LSRKGFAEAWNRLGRNSRGILRLAVVRPARAALWVVRRCVALWRRSMRRIVYLALTTPRRGLRLVRHLRYQVAVRLRGDGQA
jgi:hypothetical protein